MKCILIGYGYWGKIVEKYILSSEQFELISICDPNHPWAELLEDVLPSKQFECAFVCVPVDLHYKIVKKLLERKVHVFCEKPLCKSEKDTKELLQLARENNVVLFTDYIYTVSKALNYMKKHIKDFGRVDYIDMSIKQFGNFYPTDTVFEVIGVHMISSFLYLLDNSKDVEVISVIPIRTSFFNMIEDGTLFLKCQNVLGKIDCSLTNDSKERRIRVICERGMLVFDMMSEDTLQMIEFENVENKIVQKVLQVMHFEEGNNLQLALDEFGNNILSGNNENASITRNVSRIMEKISKSMQDTEMRGILC